MTIENKLGPLKQLIGTWEGDQGEDVAPSSSRGTEVNKFREVVTFELLNEVDNHEQILNGLRYRATAWEIGDEEPFHEEVGYWLWDEEAKQVIRSFLIPRGVSVLAGGNCHNNASEFQVNAKNGDSIFGICSNPFLDREFKTISFQMNFKLIDQNTFSYDQTTMLKIKNQEEHFSHTDKNVLKRI